MKFDVTIIAHGRAEETMIRHLRLWEAHGVPLWFVCPENDELGGEIGHKITPLGEAHHNGPGSIVRLKHILFELETRDSEYHVIYEYDSFCLGGVIPFQSGFSGNLYCNDHPSRFQAPAYPNPPWVFDHMACKIMAETARMWPDIYEEGEADRFFAALTYLSGVPLRAFNPLGYSNATITERDIPKLRRRIKEGGVMIHGVKNQWTLAACQEFYADRPQNKPPF